MSLCMQPQHGFSTHMHDAAESWSNEGANRRSHGHRRFLCRCVQKVPMGTLPCAAPELLLDNERCTEKVDVYR